MFRPLRMLIWRTWSLRSTTGIGTVEEASVPTPPSTPNFSSPIVKGYPNVAEELKSKLTDMVAGSAIIQMLQGCAQAALTCYSSSY